MRIALISYRLPAPGKRRGGVDHVAHNVAHGLGCRGHEVTVWSYDPKPRGAAYEVRMLPWAEFANSWLGFRFIGQQSFALCASAGNLSSGIADCPAAARMRRRQPQFRALQSLPA